MEEKRNKLNEKLEKRDKRKKKKKKDKNKNLGDHCCVESGPSSSRYFLLTRRYRHVFMLSFMAKIRVITYYYIVTLSRLRTNVVYDFESNRYGENRKKMSENGVNVQSNGVQPVVDDVDDLEKKELELKRKERDPPIVFPNTINVGQRIDLCLKKLRCTYRY